MSFQSEQISTQRSGTDEIAVPASNTAVAPEIPAYLSEVYSWAYLNPGALKTFEREWLVNLILWGNMRSLTDSVLRELPTKNAAQVLQIACVYGAFSSRVAAQLANHDSTLDVVDVAPIQVRNARSKLMRHSNTRVLQQDSSALQILNEQMDCSILFFLLHEQPARVREKTLREAIRVTRPGGKIVIVDYHKPHVMNPFRYLMYPVLRTLEPFALDLWQQPLKSLIPAGLPCELQSHELSFGGLYQKLVLTRS